MIKKDRFYLGIAVLTFGLSTMLLTYQKYLGAFAFLGIGTLYLFKDHFQERMTIKNWWSKLKK